MSTPTASKPQPAPAKPAEKTTRVIKQDQPLGNQDYLFDRSNYTFMIAGVILIIIGFMLMSGGKSADPHQFNFDEIYSFRRITLAPIVALIGFGLEVYAIMKKPAEQA
jgi:Protein of unknown function (DUF3098)